MIIKKIAYEDILIETYCDTIDGIPDRKYFAITPKVIRILERSHPDFLKFSSENSYGCYSPSGTFPEVNSDLILVKKDAPLQPIFYRVVDIPSPILKNTKTIVINMMYL